MIPPLLDKYISQVIDEEKTPGLAIAVTDAKKDIWAKNYGFADLQSENEVQASTKFQIGSITKTFTALAILQEIEAGRLNFHAPITDFLPWLTIKSRFGPITIHHLLTHTAGLPQGRYDIPDSKYLVAWLKEYEMRVPPGSMYWNSDLGYQILSFLLEETTGEKYGKLIQQRILDPLEMLSTESIISHDVQTRTATGYRFLYDDRQRCSQYPLIQAPWIEYRIGDGSIISTATDMAKFLRMLMNQGKGPHGRIIAEDTFNRMIQRHVERWEDSYYGYGIYNKMLGGNPVIGHGGDMLGYLSMMLADLNLLKGVVVLMNGPGGPNSIAEYVLEYYRCKTSGAALPELPKHVVTTIVEEADAFAGIYNGPNGSLEILAKGNRLYVKEEQAEFLLEQRYQDVFVVSQGPLSCFSLEFTRNRKGKIIEAHYGPNWYVRGLPAEMAEPDTPEEWEWYIGHYRSQNPWLPSIRIIVRKGKLLAVFPGNVDSESYEATLIQIDYATFSIGEEIPSPEYIKFDTIVSGSTLRLTYTGNVYYRAVTD
ncbi:MAG: serine hydrolase domain-containing protein [Candidatus Thorarchaeota archaeon]